MFEVLGQVLETSSYASVPLVLAAMGGMVSEKSGVVNISLEGGLLLAAFSAAALAHGLDSSWAGFGLGCLVGILYMLFYGFCVLCLKVHAVVAGTAFNTIAFGTTLLLSKLFFNNSSQTPLLDLAIRFETFPFVFTVLCVCFLFFLQKKTPFGLWATFAGEKPQAVTAAGLSIPRIRWASLALSGFLVGAGGAFLSIWLAGFFSKGMSAGRGFMAVAAVVLGGWNIIPTTLACLFFAFAESLQNRLQTSDLLTGLGIPPQAVQSLPYVLTLLAIAVWARSRPPRSLGQDL